MSHVVAVSLVIQDLAALEAACKQLGLQLNRGATRYKWYGTWVNDFHGGTAAYRNGVKPEDYGKCDHSIGIPGDPSAYEIGVVKNPKGEGYVLIFDFFGSRGKAVMDKVGGMDARWLQQEYALAVTEREPDIQELLMNGWEARRVIQQNGDRQLFIEEQ